MSTAIPDGWVMTAVGEVAAINPRGGHPALDDNTPVSFIPMAAVGEATGRAIVGEDRKWHQVRRGYTPMRDGDVVFAKITPCMENGKVALLRGLTNGVGAGSTELVVLRPTDAVDARYLLHFLLRDHVRQDARAVMQGAAGQLRVPLSFLASLSMPLAPVAEQRRIVAALEEHLSGLDAAVAGLARARASLARYRASVIAHAVLGDTVGAATSDAEHELPSGWHWRTTSDCCTKIDSGSTPPPEKMYQGEGEIPFIKVYNLTMTGMLDFSVRPTFVDRATHEGRLRRSRLIPGDVLTNIVGPPLGKVAVVPDTHPEWNTNQAVVCFRTGPSIINSYLALMLQADPVIKRLSSQARATAGQFNVSLTMCRTLRIPVPPIDEQRRILLETERQIELCNRVGADIDAQLARARRLRQSILQRAFAGRLVPQDSADEPAAALHGQVPRAITAATGRTARGRTPRSRT